MKRKITVLTLCDLLAFAFRRGAAAGETLPPRFLDPSAASGAELKSRLSPVGRQLRSPKVRIRGEKLGWRLDAD